MALSVKTYLNFQSGQPEIRRFSVPQDVTSSYLYLIEKIQRVYPSLLRKDLELLWQDQDGELVTFSSDEELMEALQQINSEYLKVYIRIRSDEEPDKGPEGGSAAQEHVGVVCDVCDGAIKGTRFKCMVCQDYDLCGTCERKGFHPEHEMIRIRIPKRSHHWCRGGFKGRSMPRHGHSCGKGPRPPFKGWRWPYGPGPGPFRWHDGAWNSEASTGGNKAPSNGHKADESGSKGTGWDANKDVPEYFRAFGEYLGSVLHPFGVHVETYVDPPQDQQPDENDHDSQMPPSTSSDDLSVAAESSDKTKEKKGVEPVLKDMEKTDPPDEVFAGSNLVLEPVQGTLEPDFVMVDDEKPSGDQNTSSDTKEEGTAAPQEDPFQQRLDEAVAQMEAMGFKNDDGWLTQLLVAKDCDVGRVINTILPQGRFP